jgi:hypothetical protein
MFGGLCFVAFRVPTAAAGVRRDDPSEEGSVMRATGDHSTSRAPDGSLPARRSGAIAQRLNAGRRASRKREFPAREP